MCAAFITPALTARVQGFDAPARAEAEVYDCFVEGEIPKQLDGTFYRVAPGALSLAAPPSRSS